MERSFDAARPRSYLRGMTLLDFLSELAHDPVRQLEFQRDPEAVALRAGVDANVLPVLRDSTALRAVLAGRADALVYSPETAVIYTPETAVVYTPESAMVYSAQTA